MTNYIEKPNPWKSIATKFVMMNLPGVSNIDETAYIMNEAQSMR